MQPIIEVDPKRLQSFEPLEPRENATTTHGPITLVSWNAYLAPIRRAELAKAYEALEADNLEIHADLAEASFLSLPGE